MKKIIIVYLFQIFMMGISGILLIGQLYLYVYGTMYYIENEITAPLNKTAIYTIFVIMGILSFAVSTLALMSILKIFQKVVKKMTTSEKTINPTTHE